MDEIIEEEEENAKDIIDELINEIENNKDRLNNYSNDKIVIVINYFIKNSKIYLINNLLEYLLENQYKIDDFKLYQETLIRSLTAYIKNNNNKNILNDKIFNNYMILICWNEELYFLFMKLLIIINNSIIFKYVLNIVNDIYNFDINRLLNFIINPLNIDLHIEGNIKFNLIFSSLEIFKLLLDLSIDKINILKKYYSFEFMNIYYKSELYLDNYNLNIINNIDIDKCNYNIYKYYDNLDIIKEDIIKYLIMHNAKDYDSCINKYKLDPSDYIVYSVITNNYIYFNKYINKINVDKNLNILRDLSLIDNYTNLNRRLVNRIKLNGIDKYELKKVFNNSLRYNYNLALKIYKYEQYDIDLLKIFNRNNIYNIDKIINILNIDYNNERYINLYLKNFRLLIKLLKRDLLSKKIINEILNKLLNNKLKILDTVMDYIIKYINLNFDYNICNKLYNKKYYNSLNIYLNKYYNNHRIEFNNILLNYPKIIGFYNFKDILIKLKINKEEAEYIKKHTLKYNKKNIEYIIKNIKKII